MKKIIALLLAGLMSGMPSVSAQIATTYVNENENIKFNITLPDSCINDYYTLYVLNPGKDIDDLGVIDSTTVIHYAQGEYKEGGVEVSFKINKSKYEKFSDYHFPVVVRSGNVTETITFSAYPASTLDALLAEVNSSDGSQINTLTDRLADAFNVSSFEEYSLVSDKTNVAQILFKLADAEEANENNIEALVKEAIILAGVKSGEIDLFENESVKNNDIINVSENIQKQIASIKNKDACENKVFGTEYENIEALKTALTEAILTSAIYDNTSLGYSHINSVISENSQYLESKGLNLSLYNSSQKDKVGQTLLANGDKDFSEMVSAINSLSAGNQSGATSQGTSGAGSSGSSKSSSQSGIIPVTSNKPQSTEEVFEFVDLDSVSWARAKINTLLEKGVVAKSDDKMFYPQRSITRAEFVKLVVEALAISSDSDMSFSDVNSSDWFASYIRRGVGAGIIFGDGENFYPNDNIKRQDIAAILKRALEYKGVSIANTGYAMTFKDAKNISDYAKESVEVLYQYGIISGTDTNEFLPLNNATRAEAAVMIYGVMNGVLNGLSPKYVKNEESDNSAVSSAMDDETEMLVRTGLFPAEFAADSTRKVTRAEFAKITAAFVGKSDYDTYSGNGIYADVDENTNNAGYINNMTSLGYISAKEEDLYKPNDFVSGVDAITMVMNALGYGKALNSETEILSMASSIGVSKSVPQGETPVAVSDLITLFHNTLDAEVMNVTIAGDKVTMTEGASFLETYHDVILLKGVMNGNSVTNYYTSIAPKKNTILIDSEEFYVSDALYYINDYLGYYIEIAYIGETKEIVSFEALRNEELIISDENLTGYSDGILSYTNDEEKEKRVSIPKDAIFVYNGVVIGDFDESIFDIESGSVELIGANGGEYKMVKVYNYDTILVNGASPEKIFAYGTNHEYDLESYDNVIIRGENGGLKSISDIKIYDVLSVAESRDKTQVIFNIGKASVTGKISAISSTDNTCLIDGTEYEYLPSSGITSAMSLNSGTFYIDFKGRIAHAKVTGVDSWKYGYLVKAVYDDGGNFVFKILNQEGEMEVVEQEAEVTVDGLKTTNEQINYSFCYDEAGNAHDKFYPQLIKYRQKSDGVITMIDTSYQGEGENSSALSVNRDVYNQTRIYSKSIGRLAESRGNNSSGYIENQMLIDNNTVIFAVPPAQSASEAGEDDYIVYNKSYLDGKSTVRGPVWAYDTDFENGALVKALVIPSSQSDTKLNVTAMFFVHHVGTTVNEDGEEVGYIEGYDYPSSSYKTMTSYDDENLFKDLKAGDVIRYGLDTDGTVCVISHDLDWETAKIGQFTHPVDHANGSWNTGMPQFACYYGILTHKEGKYITFSKELKEVNGEIARGNIIYDCTSALIFRFDRDSGKVKEIPAEELSAYVYSQNPDARVYVYSGTGTLKSIIIYE